MSECMKANVHQRQPSFVHRILDNDSVSVLSLSNNKWIINHLVKLSCLYTFVLFVLLPKPCNRKPIIFTSLWFPLSFMIMLYFLDLSTPSTVSINIESSSPALKSHWVCLILSDLQGSLFDLVWAPRSNESFQTRGDSLCSSSTHCLPLQCHSPFSFWENKYK